MTHSTLGDELLEALASWDIALDGAAPHETPLISSGALDSLGLFRLSVWIETKVGRAIDPAGFDLLTGWDTTSRIVRFIEAARAAERPGTP